MLDSLSQTLGYKKILSIFPELYNYRELSPFILRLTLAVIFLNMGWKDLSKKTGWRIINFILGIAKITTGIFLVVAMYTQLAAIVAVILSTIKLIGDIRTGEYRYNLGYHALLLAVSISLLLTGPGLLSFDLPL